MQVFRYRIDAFDFVPQRVNFQLRPPSVSPQPWPYLNGYVQLMAAVFADRHKGPNKQVEDGSPLLQEKNTQTSTIAPKETGLKA